MKIDSISVKFPSLKLTNQDIVNLIKDNFMKGSRSSIELDRIRKYSIKMTKLLNKSGCNTRYIRKKKERSIDLIMENITNIFFDNPIKKTDIDLLIYCGVGKKFLEPSNAYFIAREMNILCDCFDISDACMSWVRSLAMAYSFLKSNSYKRILIVNGEFNIYEHGFEKFTGILSNQELEYSIPAFTIGECTTATLVSSSADDWIFKFRSLPKYADLCTIPLHGYEDFTNRSEKIGLNGVAKFTSFGAELLDIASTEFMKFIKDNDFDLSKYDYFLPHSATYDLIIKKSKKLGIPKEKILLNTFKSFGNLVSASIPASLYINEKEGKIKRGNNILLCPMSAGISLGLVDFIY